MDSAGQDAFAFGLWQASLWRQTPAIRLNAPTAAKKLIEMERRHIRDGEARVARQEAIVRHFDSSGAPEYALMARALHVNFRNRKAASR
jgi:hypothetical protein